MKDLDWNEATLKFTKWTPQLEVCASLGHDRETGLGRCKRCGQHREPVRASG